MRKVIYRLSGLAVAIILAVIIYILTQNVDRAIIINVKAAIGIVVLVILVVLKLIDLKKRRKNKLSKSD